MPGKSEETAGYYWKEKRERKKVLSHENITRLNKSGVPTKGKEKERNPLLVDNNYRKKGLVPQMVGKIHRMKQSPHVAHEAN